MKYEIEIKDKPFYKDYFGTIIRGGKTAYVTFVYNDKKDKKIREYCVKEADRIQDDIKNNKDVNLNFCYVEGLTLKSCEIGNISAHCAFFNGITLFDYTSFNGNIDFYKTSFNGKVFFLQSSFNCYTSFSEVSFNDRVEFTYASFNCNTEFHHVLFNGSVKFDDTSFNGNVSFSNTSFNNFANFKKALFNGTADFGSTSFNRDTVGYPDFHNASFYKEAIFSNSFSKCFDFTNVTFSSYTDMRNLLSRELILDNCKVEKTLNLCNIKVEKLSMVNLQNLGLMK